VRLADLGWNDGLARAFEPWAGTAGVQPGRVGVEYNHIYRVHVEGGEVDAVVAGRLKHRAGAQGELPAVGDWVVVRAPAGAARGAIIAVLPRRSRFSRKVAGEVTAEQVVAANVDLVFLVMALDADFSPRRLERYLLLARESGADPVVVLTKPDLGRDVPAQVAETAAVAGAVPVLVVSPKSGEGVDRLASLLAPGATGALLGSSGVGKSTIINRLAGRERQRTREVRDSDSKGRHTTSNRELVALPGGGLIIDTPGMRELQLWDVDSAVRQTFDDVEAFASGCRFTDCRHREEPGCAVKAAVHDGRLAAERLGSYLKLQEELTVLARRRDQRGALESKRRERIMGRAIRQHEKLRKR
jgi:ribosome biogenesis GTPase